MKKAIIVYESVYGNTKKIAEAISEGINKVEGVESLIKAKIGAAFDSYTGGNSDVAVVKLEIIIQEKLPGISLEGRFSAKVTGRKGPLADDEESRAQEFGKVFGQKLRE